MGQVSRLRAAALAALASFSFFAFVAATPPAVAASTGTLADHVIADAMSHLNAPYRWGTDGPTTFDCSGLVYRVYADNGISSRVGSTSSAYGQLSYLRAHGETSTWGGQPGDLVFFNNGSHVGIYLGNGRVVSALTEGVKVTSIYGLTVRFTAFGHTHLGLGSGTYVASSIRALYDRYATAPLNLRAGPSTTYGRITTVARGSRLGVLDAHCDAYRRVWYRVRTASGAIGWVAGWYTKL